MAWRPGCGLEDEEVRTQLKRSVNTREDDNMHAHWLKETEETAEFSKI